MHSLIVFVHVTFLNFVWNEGLLGWRPDLSIGCRIGSWVCNGVEHELRYPNQHSGRLSSGSPELYKSVAAGNVKACPWDNEVSGFLCPEVIWTKSLSCAFVCILPRKKSPVKISMKSSLSDVYAGVIVSLSLSPLLQKCFFKWKHKEESDM